MLLTERQLRRVIRKVLLAERKTIATVSDVQKFMPQIEEWSEILLDELAEVTPRMKELDEKRRKHAVEELARGVRSALVDVTSGMDSYSRGKQAKAEERKQRDKWDRERQARGANTQYWGSWGST
tara:strand:+ start:441 stop:815 length:375 start_codon:yes stop_codon:yes gene_type:complete